MNGDRESDAQITSVQSSVQLCHATLSKYGHGTTYSVDSCSESNADQLFLCKLFDINSSSGQRLGRPQFYNEQEVR